MPDAEYCIAMIPLVQNGHKDRLMQVSSSSGIDHIWASKWSNYKWAPTTFGEDMEMVSNSLWLE